MVVLLFWLVYCMFEGYRDARYYHIKTWIDGEKDFNKHSLWSFERGMVLGFISIAYGYYLLIPLALMFPFLYLGVYGIERNNLNKHICYGRFFTHNKNMYKFLTVLNRTICFVLGLFLYFWLNRMFLNE